MIASNVLVTFVGRLPGNCGPGRRKPVRLPDGLLQQVRWRLVGGVRICVRVKNERVQQVEVVVAHQERATVRVGDILLKIDGDQHNTDVEVAAMALAPVPTPPILWRRPPVLALAALPGIGSRALR